MRTTLRIITLFLAALFFAQPVSADKIKLKNGKVIEGEIVEETNYFVKVMMGKKVQKYYKEQIDQIERAQEYSGGGVSVYVSDFDNISKEKLDLIMELIELNGMLESIKAAANQTLAKVPLERQSAMANLLDVNQITKSIIPIFDAHYTEEEVIALIQFYSSPLGQKLIVETPLIMNESVKAIMKYMQESLQTAPDERF